MGEVLNISALDPAAQETVHSSVGSTRHQWKDFRYTAINLPSGRNFPFSMSVNRVGFGVAMVR